MTDTRVGGESLMDSTNLFQQCGVADARQQFAQDMVVDFIVKASLFGGHNPQGAL